MSLPEVLLWQALRERPGGFRFRRQYPNGGYVLDFACLEARIGIEIDGEAHNRGDQPQQDRMKDSALAAAGFQIIRIAAAEVLRDPTGVADGIAAHCREVGPLHRPADGPPPRAGEDM